MRNTFWRAINSLAYPITIGMVALALLNDHVLRQHWPSWWTGKLSDFAWLVFAPFLLAALLAWVIPSRYQAKVGWLAFSLTGVGFALAKTIPFVHSAAVVVLEILIGRESGLRLDPTDLIALPALLIGWRIWRNAQDQQPTLLRRGWVMLGLGILATLANSVAEPEIDYGITCVTKNNSSLAAVVGGEFIRYTIYTSDNGGLSWSDEAATPSEISETCSERPQDEWILTDPENSLTHYRFRPGIGIERTDDGGQNWNQEIDLSWVSHEARTAYYLEHPPSERLGMFVIKTGPVDALIDPDNGNVVVAMGQDGVLVRDSAHQWRWVAVGPYSLREFDKTEFLQLLLPGEFWSALVLTSLALTTIVYPVRNDVRYGGGFLFIVAWLTWFGAVLITTPTRIWIGIPLEPAFMVAIVISVAYGVAHGSVDILDVFEERRSALIPLIIAATSTGLLFALPYVLWTQGGISRYTTARILAFALAVATIFAGQQYMKRLFQGKPLMRKRKKVDEVADSS